jgi:transposase
MKPYPVEFRHRVVALADQAMTTSEIAEVLGVTPAWVRSIRRRYEAGESLAIKSCANKRKSLAEREGARICARIAEKPGSTLEDLKRDLDLDTSITNLWKALKQLKIGLKKKLSTPRNGIDPMWPSNGPSGTSWRPASTPTA